MAGATELHGLGSGANHLPFPAMGRQGCFPFSSVKNFLPCSDDPPSAPDGYLWAKPHKVHRQSAEDMRAGVGFSRLAQDIVLRY